MAPPYGLSPDPRPMNFTILIFPHMCGSWGEDFFKIWLSWGSTFCPANGIRRGEGVDPWIILIEISPTINILGNVVLKEKLKFKTSFLYNLQSRTREKNSWVIIEVIKTWNYTNVWLYNNIPHYILTWLRWSSKL